MIGRTRVRSHPSGDRTAIQAGAGAHRFVCIYRPIGRRARVRARGRTGRGGTTGEDAPGLWRPGRLLRWRRDAATDNVRPRGFSSDARRSLGATRGDAIRIGRDERRQMIRCARCGAGRNAATTTSSVNGGMCRAAAWCDGAGEVRFGRPLSSGMQNAPPARWPAGHRWCL